MSWKKSVFKAVCLTALLSCDGTNQPGSELKRNATPDSPTSNLVRVRDGGRIDFIMVSGNKGYKLACDNPIKLNKLIEATGYPANLIATTRVLELDSQTYLDLAPGEQPVLGCQPDDKVLYRANLDGATKYFFADPTKDRTRLFMFGCQALVDAMGFQLANATELSPSFIDELKVYTANDEDDISCVSGVSVGAGIKWKAGSNSEKIVSQGTDIGFTSFEALLPTGNTAPVSVTAETGRCEWVQKIFLGSGLLVTGKTPGDFYNQSCELTITAAAGTPLENSLKYKLSTERLQPIVTTNCAPTHKLAQTTAFPSCVVEADKGNLTMTVKPEANCQDVFQFDASTSKLSLIGLPLLGVSCQAEFSSELNGVVSETKSVAVERVCAVGTRPNASGTCDVVMCDAAHKYEDVWTVPSNESKSNRLMYCGADGRAEDRGIASCFAGYEKRGSECLKSCSTGFLEGDVRSSSITNGTMTEICRNGAVSQIKSCNANALLRNNACLLTCDNIHVDGNVWDVVIPNGTQKKSCNGTTLKPGAITCSSGYLLRGSSCKIACDAQHAAGDTWSTPIDAGKRDSVCNSQGQIVNTISCKAGYEVRGQSCVKTTPPPPPAPRKCGPHAHGSNWQISECRAGDEYRVSQRCNDGSVIEISAVKIAPNCF